MQPIRLIQFMILILSILKAFSLVTGANAQAPEASFTLYMPVNIKEGEVVPSPAPPPIDEQPPINEEPPTVKELPAELVTTWYTGALPLIDFYDPATGTWRAQNGLGETYTFSANGDYIYAAFLRLQNGQCLTEASSYREGKVQAANGTLKLTPDLAKTRTVVRCGSNSETTNDGPFDVTTLAYQVAEEANGHIQLTLTDQGNSTSFYRQGMVESLVGKWQRGAVSSVGFYDPATQSFAPQNGEGGWYSFEADGSYQFGEFGYGTDNQGCALTAWIYQEGTISMMGGRLTTMPTAGALRVDNACNPATPVVTEYVEEERSYTWLYRDRDSDPKLVLIPLEAFQEFIYLPE